MHCWTAALVVACDHQHDVVAVLLTHAGHLIMVCSRLDSSSVGDTTLNAAFLSDGVTDMVHSWEVQLVLEYCDQGSLRQLLNNKDSFTKPGQCHS